MGSKVVVAVSDGTSMSAYVARPLTPAAPKAGIILSQEAFGVNAHMRDVAQRLAAEGYLTITPELFHRTAPGADFPYEDFEKVRSHFSAMTVPGIEADLRAARLWLQNEKVASIGAVGFCLGGRASYLANSTLPLKAAVSFYGAGIQGFLDRAKDQHGPIMFFWGGKDKHIPASARREISDVLTASGKPFVDVLFSAADHGFFNNDRAAYDPAAAEEAFALVRAFFKRNLA